MEKKWFHKRMCLVVLFVFLLIGLAFAAGKDILKIQGRVMDLDLNHNMMVVNEKLFVWDSSTIIRNEKGVSLTPYQLRNKTWVYIEGLNDKGKKRIVATKIYLLPKRIDGKEKHLYSFME